MRKSASFLASWYMRPVVAVVMCVLIGCLKGGAPPEPFDNESLRLLSVSGKDFAYLRKPSLPQRFDISAESVTSLVEALRPITSTKVGQLPPNAVDYEFGFSPGRNPVCFRVNLANGRLVYWERQYLYEGGDAKAFKQAADAIVQNSDVRGER
jgi:hypothetical protein